MPFSGNFDTEIHQFTPTFRVEFGASGKTMKLLAGILVAGAAAVGLITAPPVAADCSSSGYATVCAQGDVRGGGGGGPVSGPYYPYPCEDDWLCNDGELSVIVDPGPPGIWPGPGRPGGPGGPGRPGGIGPR
jgi:hypothetical protein